MSKLEIYSFNWPICDKLSLDVYLTNQKLDDQALHEVN